MTKKVALLEEPIVDTAELVKFIRSLTGNTIFSVRFIKRTTGEDRHMVCRLNVSKGVTGEGLKFDPLEKGLLPVYDLQKDGFRMINLDTIISITARGETKVF
jgi:hypothetical protein